MIQNSKDGLLIFSCVLVQFKRTFKRNDKPVCSAICLFIAHLVNQQIADDMLAFEIAIVLLDNPSGAHGGFDIMASQ